MLSEAQPLGCTMDCKLRYNPCYCQALSEKHCSCSDHLMSVRGPSNSSEDIRYLKQAARKAVTKTVLMAIERYNALLKYIYSSFPKTSPVLLLYRLSNIITDLNQSFVITIHIHDFVDNCWPRSYLHAMVPLTIVHSAEESSHIFNTVVGPSLGLRKSHRRLVGVLQRLAPTVHQVRSWYIQPTDS